MSVARTLIKLREFQINSAETLAYGHDATTSTNVKNALDWIFAVLYPNSKDSVPTYADLPLTLNTLNDYRVVLDDGDGKAAGYRWESREGDIAPSWYKIHDMDWSSDGILTALLDQTNELYVSKYGREDQDESGTPIAGIFAGQNVYGGTVAGSGLTLHANAGDTSDLPADQTGYIQFNGNARATYDGAFDLGTTGNRFRDLFISRDISDGTDTVTVADLATAIIHANTVTGNPHGTGYDDLTNKVGTLTVDGDVSGSVDLSTSGAKTLTITVADDSHTHTISTLTDFDANIYSKSKLILKDSTQVTWTFDDLLEEATPTVALTTLDISDIDEPASNGILVGNEAGDAWVVSAGEIELVGDATGSGTFDSVSGKWTISTSVASSSLSGVTDVTLVNKLFTSAAGDPATVTATAHGLITGEKVSLYGSTLIGVFIATVVDANSFTVPFLMAAPDSGYYIPNGAQLLWDPTLEQFKIAKEYEEIRLGELAGLTEDVLSTYVAKDGRATGQTIKGGISASENLVLESTSNATKGTIQFKDAITPFTDASYSGGWSGTNIGSVSSRVNNIYMAGEAVGFRVENVGSLPSPSGTKIGRLVTFSSKLYMDTGSALIKVGSGDISASVKTANYTVIDSDDVILCNAISGGFTVSLPAASTWAKALRIKKTDSSDNTITIDANGSETIDDLLTYLISNQYACINIISDGSNWHII